jgi:hypothetical protein
MFLGEPLDLQFLGISSSHPKSQVEIEGQHADTRMGTVPTNGGGCIAVGYKDYVDIFSEDRAETVEPHRPIDHGNNLEPGFNTPDGRIYNLSDIE